MAAEAADLLALVSAAEASASVGSALHALGAAALCDGADDHMATAEGDGEPDVEFDSQDVKSAAEMKC